MTYDETYNGRVYQMIDGHVYTLNKFGGYTWAGTTQNAVATVLLTGYIVKRAGKVDLYQTTTGGYIDLTDGWQYGYSQTVARISQRDAQSIVDKIIRNNKRIIANNLLCARFADRLTDSQRETLYQLQTRLEKRDSLLRNEGICTSLQESYPSGYSYLQSALESFMSETATVAGVGSVTVTIIVSAVVLASVATACYYAYRYYADESERDVRFSDDLTRTLTAKLTDAEYQQLQQETAGLITKAKIKTSLSSMSGALKYLAIGAGAYFIINSIKH